jgi:hypothetical protein
VHISHKTKTKAFSPPPLYLSGVSVPRSGYFGPQCKSKYFTGGEINLRVLWLMWWPLHIECSELCVSRGVIWLQLDTRRYVLLHKQRIIRFRITDNIHTKKLLPNGIAIEFAWSPTYGFDHCKWYSMVQGKHLRVSFLT